MFSCYFKKNKQKKNSSVFFYILKQNSSQSSYFREACSAVLLQSTRKCFVDDKLHLSLHQHGDDKIMTEFSFMDYMFLLRKHKHIC